MINSCHLKNFQSHKDTVINFSDGLNIITGPSDAGKTTILRALDWIHNGRPVGFGFHSNWCGHGDKTEVRIEYDNGYIYRAKSKSKNEWDCNGTSLKATGKTVPLEVQDLTNWSELNYAGQFDPSFLLSDSEGQVAKKLNELVNLDIIDRTIGNISKETKRVVSSIDGKKEEKKSFDEQLEKYSDLKKAELAFQKLECIENKYFDGDDEYRDLKQLIISIEDLEDELKEFKDLDVAIEEVVNLIQQSEDITKLKNDKNQLSKALNGIIEKHNELKSYQNVDSALSEVVQLISDSEVVREFKVAQNDLKLTLSGIEAIEKDLVGFGDLEEAHSDVLKLIGGMDELNEKRAEKDSLETQIGRIKSLVVDVKAEDESALALEEEFKEAMGDRCPLCESEIGD